MIYIPGYRNEIRDTVFVSEESRRVGRIDDECRDIILLQRQKYPSLYRMLEYYDLKLSGSEKLSQLESEIIKKMSPEKLQEVQRDIKKKLASADPEEKPYDCLAIAYGILNEGNLIRINGSLPEYVNALDKEDLQKRGIGARWSIRLNLDDEKLPRKSDIHKLIKHRVYGSEIFLVSSKDYDKQEVKRIVDIVYDVLTPGDIKGMDDYYKQILSVNFAAEMGNRALRGMVPESLIVIELGSSEESEETPSPEQMH